MGSANVTSLNNIFSNLGIKGSKGGYIGINYSR